MRWQRAVRERGPSAVDARSREAAGRGRSGRHGFALLEILLVVALVGIISSVLLVGGSTLLRERAVTADDVFWRAVSEARRFALLHQQEVRLSYDRESRRFTAVTRDGSESFPVPGEGELQIDFLAAQRAGRAILVGGVLLETQVLPAITFYDDGTCTPFRVQLRTGTEQPRIIAVDPWTCAPMLESEGR